MQSSVSIAPVSVDSIVISELPSQKPTTLLLRTNRPYLYNTWTINNRLRLQNEKLIKRQRSSCRIAFYSLCLCVSAGVMIIIVYRFTDECSLTTNQKEFFFIKCLRHWLYLIAICISLLASIGVIFGTCRYFRSQTLNFLYDDDHEQHSTTTNSLLPMTIRSNSLTNSAFRQSESRDDERSTTTVISSLTNTSLRRKMPPFNYDELPPETNPIIIRKSPNMNNNINKTLLFSASTSTLSSPQSVLSTARSSNTITNSNKDEATSTFEDIRASTPTSYTTCISGVDIWGKQQRLSSYR